MADKRLNVRSPYYIDSNPPEPNLFTCAEAAFHIVNGITGDNIVIGTDATVQEGTLTYVFPTTYQSGETTYYASIVAPEGYDNAGETITLCTDNAIGSEAPLEATCSDAGFSVADGTTGQTVSASTQNGFILNSVSPSTYQSGTNTYTANITVPSGYPNAGATLTTCTDTATGSSVTVPVDPEDPQGPTTEEPDIEFTCSEANFRVSNGTVGTTILIGSDATSNGALISVSPSTYQSGTATYTGTIQIPSGYTNSGTITCADTAIGSPAATYYYTLVERCDGGGAVNVRSTVQILGVYSSVLYNGNCYEVAGGGSPNTNDITSPYPDCTDCCDKAGNAGGCTSPDVYYYALTRCNPEQSGFISGQTTTEITLNVNDRVVVGSTYYTVTGTATTGTSVGNVTDTGNTGCPPVCTGIAIFRSLTSPEDVCCAAKGGVQYFNNTSVGTSDRFYAFDSSCTTLHSGTAYIMDGNNPGYYYTFVNGIKTAGPTLCPSCP